MKPNINEMSDEEIATWFENSSPEDYHTRIEGKAEILLYRAAKLKKQAEKEAIEAVKIAKKEGYTWQMIGDFFGMTRQGAYKNTNL